MIVALALIRHAGKPQHALLHERREQVVVAHAHALPPRADLVYHLELSVKESRDNLAGRCGTADVEPGVFVDLSAQECATVCALVAKDTGTLDQCRVVHAERPAFSTDEVLRLVK